jgi:hypothetical protein
MPGEIPQNTPEKKETLDDNARKFVTDAIDSDFLKEHEATSFILATDWLETNEDNEKKLAYKEFDNGDVQILLIAKVTKEGNRTSEKTKISSEKYANLLSSSILHLEKKRYEFTFTQNDIPFSMKYDEFTGSNLRILEVDASTEDARDAFNPDLFPGELTEVTGNISYYGYRVANTI